MWSIIKTTINKNKKINSEEQLKLNDSTITTDKQTISNKFNDFSINVGAKLSRKIPKQDVLPEHYMKFNSLNSLYIEPLHEQEVFKLISSLKSTAGYDNLSATLLKLCSSSKTPPLTHICYLSLQEGVFPDEMNIANIIPLLKNEDPQMLNNYRPVSVLCALSKVFEKIMYNRLLNYLNKQKKIFSHQFGFRKHHSTYMALMTLVDIILLKNNCRFMVYVVKLSPGFKVT